MSLHVTQQNYDKKVDDSFFAYGQVVALFRGPEHIANQVLTSVSKNKRANSIRVFDIILYKDIVLHTKLFWSEAIIEGVDQMSRVK